jgi:hypothetical protein
MHSARLYFFRFPSGKSCLTEHPITRKVYEDSTYARDEVGGFCSSTISLFVSKRSSAGMEHFPQRLSKLVEHTVLQSRNQRSVSTRPSCYVKTGRTAPWRGSRLTKNLEGPVPSHNPRYSVTKQIAARNNDGFSRIRNNFRLQCEIEKLADSRSHLYAVEPSEERDIHRSSNSFLEGLLQLDASREC